MNLFNLVSLVCFSLIFLANCSKETSSKIEGMVFIPGGEFTIGSDENDAGALGKEFGARQGSFFANEKPLRKVFLKGFYIDKFEVTNEDFKFFSDQTGHPPPPTWEKGIYIANQETHPVENTDWFDADKYCKWVKKRLPTEEEWEKAARGPDGNQYPWGNEFDIKKSNFNRGDTVPVDGMVEDRSYFGVYGMGGNVMEWTSSWYEPYPDSTMESKDFGEKHRVLRGGAGTVVGHYSLSKIYSRSSARHYYLPGGRGNDSGFRCAKDE